MIGTKTRIRPDETLRPASRHLLISLLVTAASLLACPALATSTDPVEPWMRDVPAESEGPELGLELNATPGLGQPVGWDARYYDPGFHMGLSGGMRIGAAWIGGHVDYTPLNLDAPPGMVVTGEASLLMVAGGAKVHLVPDGLVDPVLGARIGYFELDADGTGGFADISGVAVGGEASLLFRIPPSGDGPRFLIGPTVGFNMLLATEVCLNNSCLDNSDTDLGSMGYLNGGLTLGFEHLM